MSDGKLSLNLNEENELTFKISIEGSASEPNINKPNIRFTLAEKGEGHRAWLYSTIKDDDGNIIVSIPGESYLSEEKEYVGQLEVILGNHYFVPTTVDIDFIKPLKVEAAVLSNGRNLQENKEKTPVTTVTVTSGTATVRTKNMKSNNPRGVQTNKKRLWEDLTIKEQTKIKKILREKKLKQLRKAKRLSDEKRRSKESTEKNIKDQLKSLLGDSLLGD